MSRSRFLCGLTLPAYSTNGAFIDECAGITGNEQEVLALTLREFGTYQAQIINYAGVMVDYSLDVSQEWEAHVFSATIRE
jgi:hypothetical protein